ncbi:MAG TPA: glutathione S-transferase family protein [Rickettsiales bacterium]|nr:glutathione S-transferase family protein [Rickettsiales bacterium]
MKLYYFEVLNPRKACAAAKYLNSPVEFVHVNLGKGEHRTPEFLAMNPNAKVPVLQDGDYTLWESNAIICYLSNKAKSDLWPQDAQRQIEVIKWLNWDSQHFTRAAGALYFEYYIKSMFNLGPVDEALAAESQKEFAYFAAVLEQHLKDHKYLVADTLSVADFAVGITLPYADKIHLPLADFPAIQRWHDRLNSLPAWREPFPEHSQK